MDMISNDTNKLVELYLVPFYQSWVCLVHIAIIVRKLVVMVFYIF